MPNDFELFLVQISMNEAILRRIIDGHKPEFAVVVTLQDHAQPALKRAGKHFSQISGPKLRGVSHRIDSRRGDDRWQVMTLESLQKQFQDPMTTMAAIDRLVHHAVILLLSLSEWSRLESGFC